MRFVLVPGAGGSALFWHRLVPLLPDAIAVELPAADETAGLQEYADTIVAAAGAGPVTLVAQSLGGFSAPLAAERLDVRRIVLVNAMIPRPGEAFGQWWEAVGYADSGAPPFDLTESFFHDVPPEVTKVMFAAGEPQQSDLPEPWPLAGWPAVPTVGVAGADDRFFPPDFQQRIAKDRLDLELTILPGGHLLPLSRPEALADYLLAL